METRLNNPNDIILIPLMHEMQCLENIMIHGPKDSLTKSDDKGMNILNK